MSLPSILNAPKGVVIDDAGSHWSITVSTQSPVAAFYLFFMLFWSVGILSVLVNLIAARMALLSLTSVVLSVFFSDCDALLVANGVILRGALHN